MIIEIRRAGFVNKGAELMLHSVLLQLRDAFPDAIFTMSPSPKSGTQPFRNLVDIGLYPKASLYRKGIQWGRLARFVPKSVREMYGIILDQDVDVVIDAAGFAYSDQWDVKHTTELLHSVLLWKKQGTTVILMPQAFGPFDNRQVRNAMSKALDHIDLLMPRDSISHKYLIDLAGDRANMKRYPDFTNLIPGKVPSWFDTEKYETCIVPNHRMIDKTAEGRSNQYLPFMIRCTERLLAAGKKPFILIHEGSQDQQLATMISDAVGGIPILTENDSLKIKGIIGSSHGSLGSRFHGLVSALSQGIPCLATGWSHKYLELMMDYDFEQGMISVSSSPSQIDEALEILINPDLRTKAATHLLKASEKQKDLSLNMWREVKALIEKKRR